MILVLICLLFLVIKLFFVVFFICVFLCIVIFNLISLCLVEFVMCLGKVGKICGLVLIKLMCKCLVVILLRLYIFSMFDIW